MMADKPDSKDVSAEKAYAEAAAAKPVAAPAPAKTAAPKKAPTKAKTPVKPKVAVKPKAPVMAKKPAKPVSAPVKSSKLKTRVSKPKPKPAPAKAPVAEAPKTKPAVTEMKELIMAAAKTPDYTAMMTEMQTRAKDAYEKGTAAMGEMTEFTKGNVEAVVESSKIVAGGVQDLGKTCVEEAKSAYETMTSDLKDMAAIKSPTELFQLQGKIMRRNFDAFIATGSKNTEAMMKLANDAFAPISSRVNLAAEKISKVA